MTSTATPSLTMAQRVALAATEFQQKRTGHAPKAVTVILNDNTLVVTLQEALSPAEKALAKTAEGAAKVQEFHRKLFHNSVDALRDEIKRITGVAVREADIEVETANSAVIQAFTTGTVVQVFQLAGTISVQAWNAAGSEQ
jgi:uncharacterized protein YbcI